MLHPASPRSDAQDFEELVVDGKGGAGFGQQLDAIGRRPKDRLQGQALLLERSLGLDLLSDVTTGAAIAQERPGGIVARLAADRAPARRLVEAARPEHEVAEGFTPRHHCVQRRDACDSVPVLRRHAPTQSKPAGEREVSA